jgi:hypothetical protein
MISPVHPNNQNNLSSTNLNNNHSQNLFSVASRKATIHDLTQILIEDCQKV